jgi:glucan endo-1,3-beta-D-glucosidase
VKSQNFSWLIILQQGGTTNDPTSAIPAAIAEDTTLLLGLWASAGQSVMTNEIDALKTAISTYGANFTDRVIGISVGSEDLYRDSVMGIEAKAGIGAGPDTLVTYINQVRSAISGTALSKSLVGHVDTWTGWTNSSVTSVINTVDFLGVDAYPYFQSTMSNSIQDAQGLFNSAMAATQGVSGGKPVWVTETGYPVSGNTSGLAVPSLVNAKTYWDEVGCSLFGKTNTWWYTLQDADPITPDPSFGIVGGQLSTTPLFNLTCPPPSTTSSSASTTATLSSTATGSGSASGGASTTAAPSGSSSSSKSPSGSAAAPSSTGAANALSGSVVAVMGAFFAVLAVL